MCIWRGLCASSVTVPMLYSSHQKNESDTTKEVLIMQTTMNYRGITRYSYDTTKPIALTAFFRRMVSFFKAALATRKNNPHSLSNDMSARLYL